MPVAPFQGSCHARSMHEPCTRHARELGFVLQLLTEEQNVPCFFTVSLSKMVRFQPDGFSLRPREVQDMATSAYVVSDMNSKVFPCAVLQVWSFYKPRRQNPHHRLPDAIKRKILSDPIMSILMLHVHCRKLHYF